jgi:hypothetical protein
VLNCCHVWLLTQQQAELRQQLLNLGLITAADNGKISTLAAQALLQTR